MMEHKLGVNEKFELVVKEGPFKGNYLSQVADIHDTTIEVTIPYVRGEIIPLRLNLGITMNFIGEQAAFLYETKIIDRIDEPVPMLILEYPQKKHRVQRREYFRLDVKKKVNYRILDDNLKPITKMKETETIDISGGGLKMVLNEVINKGTLIELYIQIPELENTAIISRIVNIFDLPDGIAVGVKFVEIDRYIREDIIGWLFDYQRELRQRGML